MSLRALAFGPLPKSQVQASQRLSLPSAGGGPRLSGLGGGGGGDYDAALTVGGPQREPEAFSPVFPDLFAANQGGGDVMDLPGAGGGEPDFNSEAAQGLASPGLLARPGPAASQDTSGLDAGGFENDFSKALKALQQGMKLGKSGQGLVNWLTSEGITGAVGGGAGLGSLAGSAAPAGSAIGTGGGMAGAGITGTAGGGGSLSGLGTAGGVGTALSALLGILASATGDEDLAMAAKAAGIGSGALGLASTGTSLAGLLGGLSTAAAVPGSAAAAAAGAGAGIGVGAGAAFAPIALFLLADSIMGMAGSKDAPNLIGNAMKHRSITGDYYRFAPDLARNLTNSSKGLGTLSQALPYVQSQEELGRLINTYKNFVGTTNNWELGNQFGEGGVTDPYRIGNLPGAGGSPHEGGISADLGPQVNLLQSQIDALRPGLPGTPITGGYGSPGGGFEGPDLMRLWTQFQDRSRAAPKFNLGEAGTPGVQQGEGMSADIPSIARGFYSSATPGGASPNALTYGQEGYDYAGSGFPEPGKFVGEKSAAYQNLTLESILRALMGGSNGIA